MGKNTHIGIPSKHHLMGEVCRNRFDENSRQLTAIMFTDIEGYTALMEANEAHAITLRQRHRKIFEELHNKYRGEILQYYGDGTLSIFKSSLHAVKCAIELQQESQQDPEIPLRIGIHIGDILRTDEDIIGDGVNVAARIESLAEAGAILLSGQLQYQIRNTEVPTKSLGIFHLKNISKPVEIFAVSQPGLQIPTRTLLLGKISNNSTSITDRLGDLRFISQWILLGFIAALIGTTIYFSYGFYTKADNNSAFHSNLKRGVAVLPFDNLSGDANQQYFVDGMTDEIHSQLAIIKDLRIPSLITSSRYKGGKKSASEIAEDLVVNHLLKGTVRKSENRTWIRVKLIDAKEDEVLWTEQYEGPPDIDSIFVFQSSLASKIASDLEVTITSGEQRLMTQIPTQNWLAYDYYLRGRERTKVNAYESNLLAMDYFRKAIREDSAFALAYRSLASAMVRQTNHFGQDQSWLTDSAWQVLNEGLLHEPVNPDLVTQEYHLLTLMGKFDEADAVLEKLENLTGPENMEYIIHKYLQANRKGDLAAMMNWSIQWEKSDTDPENAIWTYVNNYCWLGEFEKAKSLLRNGDELQRLFIYLGEAMANGEFEAARKYAEEMIPLNPYVGRMETAEIDIRLGDYPSAKAHLLLAIDSFPTLPFPGSFNRSLHTLLAFCYAKEGNFLESANLLELVRESDLNRINAMDENMKYAYDLASIYAVEGDTISSMKWLRNAMEKGLKQYWRIEGDPIFDPFSNSSQYLDIISEMKNYIKAMHSQAKSMERQRQDLQ